MSGFSDDGRWWWDGAQWIVTSQVVMPDPAVAVTANHVLVFRNRFPRWQPRCIALAARSTDVQIEQLHGGIRRGPDGLEIGPALLISG